jgi:hypothetical protein
MTVGWLGAVGLASEVDEDWFAASISSVPGTALAPWERRWIRWGTSVIRRRPLGG